MSQEKQNGKVNCDQIVNGLECPAKDEHFSHRLSKAKSGLCLEKD